VYIQLFTRPIRILLKNWTFNPSITSPNTSVLQEWRLRTDRFSDAWQVTTSECATSLDPGMYGRYSRLSPSHWRLVKDGVRKSPQQRPTVFLVDFRVEFRHATNCLDTGVHTAEKLFPQTRSTIFRTNNMPHRRPVVPPARLLIHRP
jgi:hypothetical protein